MFLLLFHRDAMHSFHFGHLEVELTADQCIRLTDSGRLAGSAQSMDRGLENLMKFTGLNLRQALQAGTENAAKACRLESRMGFLQPGDAADLILFDYDPETHDVEVRETVVGYDG